ncbi:MAG: preprotein translocase subunit TatC, partial [Halobacteriaceae archaeon]
MSDPSKHARWEEGTEDEGSEVSIPDENKGPPEDEEMPLTEHIEEMLKRLAIVIGIAGIVSVATFPFGEEIINFLWYSVLPGSDIAKP